jgi:endonuclease G
VTGYDASFLGPDDALTVPLPVPRPAPDAPDGAPPRVLRQLDHPHFSILLDPVRRLAAATSCLVDGADLRPLRRSGTWRLDSQAPDHEQAGNELYRDNALDRGHLVRRLDPMWGAEAAAAGRATFVYTNAAPQVDAFNQSKVLWNGLEDHVLAYADTQDHRLVVHTGCVFDPADPVYRGIALPRQFWKVAAWADGTVLRAAAFVLDQSPQLGAVALRAASAQALAAGDVPPLGPYRTFQVPVADVERLTGLDLGPLVDADVLPVPRRAVGPLRVGTPPPGWTELTTTAEVALAPAG